MLYKTLPRSVSNILCFLLILFSSNFAQAACGNYIHCNSLHPIEFKLNPRDLPDDKMVFEFDFYQLSNSLTSLPSMHFSPIVYGTIDGHYVYPELVDIGSTVKPTLYTNPSAPYQYWLMQMTKHSYRLEWDQDNVDGVPVSSSYLLQLYVSAGAQSFMHTESLTYQSSCVAPSSWAFDSQKCVIDCPFGLDVGNNNQCAPKPLLFEDLNKADENGCSTGNPVNIATGNKFFNITDYIDKSNPLLKVIRSYDSGSSDWAFDSAFYLAYEADSNSYVLTFANGSKGSFIKQEEKWIRYENPSQEYLTKTATGVTYHGIGNHKATFNDIGQITSEQQGYNQIHYSYAVNGDITITDPVRQRSLQIAFNAQQKVSSITLPNQKNIIYLYDANNRLATVNNQGKDTTYLFENMDLPKKITKVIDANGTTYKEISYYPDGRVQSSSLNLGHEITRFTYPDSNQTTTTNALGKQTSYNFVDIKGVKKIVRVEGHATASCLAANQHYEYYPDGHLKSKTDWKGIATEFVYNEQGLEIQRTEAVGMPEQRIISTTWHPQFNLPTSVTIGNQVTTYGYDVNGLLTSQSKSYL